MKEHPILFSGEMVRAILEGHKTQTRRVVKNPERLDGLMLAGEEPDWCPYGGPGDRLWVRETWGVGTRPCPHRGWVDGIEYRADTAYLEGPDLLHLRTDVEPPDTFEFDAVPDGWRPSIHMPRWACRTVLEVVSVRVERLQEITEEDARAEGFPDPPGQNRMYPDRARYWFQNLWDSINAKRGHPWDLNPWVWVVEFQKEATK